MKKILIVIFLLIAGDVFAQNYPGQYGTKMQLAGSGTDIVNWTKLIAGANGAPWTLTLPTSGGTGGYVLRTDGSGVTSWVAQTAGFANPMTTTGDGIYSSDNSGTAARLAIGTANQVLGVSGGIPSWATLGTDATLLGDGRGTTFKVDLTRANTWTGTITENKAAIGATYTNGMILQNSTASSGGATVQQAPSLYFGTHGWSTTGTPADSTLDARMTLIPATASVATSSLQYDFGNATGGYLTKFILNSSGTLQATLFSGSGASLTSLSGSQITSGTVPVANGGTGQATYTDGQILIGNSSGNTLTKATLSGTTNQISVTNGGGTITLATPQSINTTSSPTFAALTLTAPLTVPNGGTGAATLTSNGLLLGNGTSTITAIAAGTNGQVLKSNGIIPAYFTLTTDATMTGNGVSTSFAVDLTHANTWTGTQSLGGVAYPPSSPTQLSSDQADWAIGTANSVYYISSSTAVNVTGIASGAEGRRIVLVNVGSNAMTFKNESSSSTAANRLHLVDDNILGADGVLVLNYDNTSTNKRWRKVQ